MREFIFGRRRNNNKETPILTAERLNYQGNYSCPVCRYGEISSLTLMDAFACNFCRHIFSANLDKQIIEMVDSSQSLSWYWNGKNWQGVPRTGVDFGWEIGVLAVCFVAFPPIIVGLAAYLFPPLPGSPLSWFPLFWTGLTFATHFGCVLWLIVEYYQFPVFAFLRTWGEHLGRRS